MTSVHDAHDELRRLDEQLAHRFGAYLSYATGEGPAVVEHHGQPPAELVDRLLDLYARPDGCFLDVGCGAGHTLCRLAPRVRKAWGIDELAEPLDAARVRARAAGLTNVTVVRGNAVERVAVDQLPDGRFTLALSRRGPNFNEHLVRTLTPGAHVLQELVGGADCAELRELLAVAPPGSTTASGTTAPSAATCVSASFPLAAPSSSSRSSSATSTTSRRTSSRRPPT